LVLHKFNQEAYENILNLLGAYVDSLTHNEQFKARCEEQFFIMTSDEETVKKHAAEGA